MRAAHDSAVIEYCCYICHLHLGCDGSILIESLPSKPLEMAASKNFGIRKREAINLIKLRIEVECPGQVSCADILVLAAREAVAISGGPSIQVPLGRRDSPFSASSESADASLPPADIGVDDALGLFGKLGMTAEEAVAILGAHTLGITHCLNVMDRLYKSYGERAGEINPKFEAVLKVTCPQWIALTQNTSFVFNDPSTFHFDNLYFKNALAGQGVLRIDAELPLHPKTASIVQQFGADQDHFFQAFGSAFVKLSRAGALTGTQGVIRNVCSVGI